MPGARRVAALSLFCLDTAVTPRSTPAEADQREVAASRAIPALGVIPSALLFGGAGLLLWFVTHALIPATAARTEIEPVLLWFLFGALGVFLPLLIAAYLIVRGKPRAESRWGERLRFRRMTQADWLWTIGGLIAIGLLSALSVALLTLFSGAAPLHPSFMRMEPLGPGRYWLLAVWLPFWVLNIGAEELLWRGALLPRQEVSLGRRAWLANGAGWLLFHLAFGPVILLTLWPITFILPYVVQRTKNSWTGVLIHAGLNGPAFLALAFGFV